MLPASTLGSGRRLPRAETRAETPGGPSSYSSAGRSNGLPSRCSSRNASTVAYQSRAFWGFRIQWFSSGK